MCFLRKRPEIQPLCVNGKVSYVPTNFWAWLSKTTVNGTSTSKCPPVKRRNVSTSSECYGKGAFHHRAYSTFTTLQFALSSNIVALFGTTACQNTYLKNIEMVQKRALGIILPGTLYSEALAKLNYPRLDARRTYLCQKTIRNIASGGYLSRHLPQTRESSHKCDIRNKSSLSTFNCRTNRFQKSLFPSMTIFLNL